MASTSPAVLGIDINRYEIRVAEVGGSWADPQVRHVGAFPTPRGAVVGTLLSLPQVIGDALRAYLTEQKITTREAVFGIAPESLLTRTLDVPLVPDAELRTVIQGEMSYQKLVREDVAVFDYARLGTVESAAQSGPQALVMAAEEGAVAGYAAVAERAGLRLLAAEPVLLALLRAGYRQVQNQPAALCVSIADGTVELSVIDGGVLRLYRRADIAHEDLVVAGPPAPDAAPAASPFPFPGDLDADNPRPAPHRTVPRTTPLNLAIPGAGLTAAPAANGQTPDRHLNPSAAQTLALELSRSLDYYQREFPQALAVGAGVLSCDDPVLEPLADFLAQALSLDFAVAAPPAAAPETWRALGAVGLALRPAPDAPAAVPSFDLSVRQRALGDIAAARRKLSIALAAAIVLVLFGIIFAYVIGLRANAVEHELYHEKEDLAALQRTQQQMLSDLQAQQTTLQALRGQGIPVPRLMDSVAAGVAPGAGLTDVSLDTNGSLKIGGEASNERAMIATVQGLRSSPYFLNPSLDSFDSTAAAAGAGRVIKFQISSQLAGAPAPPAAPH